MSISNLPVKNITYNGAPLEIAGGDDGYKDKFEDVIDRSISGSLTLDTSYVGRYALAFCTKVTEMYLPNLTSMDEAGFTNNSGLIRLEAPLLTRLKTRALHSCLKLQFLHVPSVTSISSNACQDCKTLETLDLPACTYLGAQSLDSCQKLSILILRADTVCQLANVSALEDTPIKSGTGYVYVNDNRYEEYLVATNWTVYANQIKPISELPEEV